MKTKLKSIHEEEYSDNSRSLGVILNYDINTDWKESFIFIYKNDVYVFFDCIIHMIDYLMYAEKSMKRAYMEEKQFDEYFDADFIDGSFRDKLNWV